MSTLNDMPEYLANNLHKKIEMTASGMELRDELKYSHKF